MPTGRDAEQYVADRLEDAGYETYIPPKAKYRGQDIFGEWDILAFGRSELLAVQVKSGRDASGVNAWFEDNRQYAERILDLRILFVHVVDTDLRVACRTPDGWKWIIDERDDNGLPTDDFESILG